MTNFDENNKPIQDVSFQTVEPIQAVSGEQAEPSIKSPKQKKTHSRMKTVVASVLAVAIIGGASGFGGAYLGNYIDTSDKGTSSEVTTLATNSPSTSNDTEGLSQSLDNSNTTLLTTEELYAKVKNTVVLIYNYQQVQGYSEVQPASCGSGVVFTSDGYIVTNQHVVESAAKMTVFLPDSTGETHEYEAEVVGSDASTDLAVLKVSVDYALDYAVLGDSDTLKVGQDICALGNPMGLTSSLTKGIVSGLSRQAASNGYGLSAIQVDAAVNSGNSGGAIFDMYGNVMGIVNKKLVASNAENIGFAITINEAKPVINDLLTVGYVTGRPGLGINGEAITEYLAYLQGINTTGVYVTYISEDKPVAKSGLRIGDIITEIDGTSVASLTDVQSIVAKKNIGDTVELTVYRKDQVGNQKTTTITVELSEITLN